jgi:hypothetical protein
MFWQLKVIEKPSSVRKKKRQSNTLTFTRKKGLIADFGIVTQAEGLTQIDN